MAESPKNQSILILGGAGRVGQHLLQQATIRGYHVTAVMRDIDQCPEDIRPKIKLLIGDLEDQEILSRLGGLHFNAVLSTLGIFHKSNAYPLARITEGVMIALAGQPDLRWIVMSSLGVDDSCGQGNLSVKYVTRFILKYVLRDKTQQEKVVKENTRSWTIIRPPQLIHTDKQQNYQRWEGKASGGRLRWKISTADAAREMLHALEHPELIGKAYQISY